MGIYSIWGPPQSGKTTLAVALAGQCAKAGKTVCLIAPVPFSELSAMLEVQIPTEKSLQTAIRGTGNLRKTVVKAMDSLYVLAYPTLGDSLDDHFTSRQVEEFLEMAKVTFDVVLVDCPCSMDNLVAAWAMQKSEKVLLCLGCCPSSVLWHKAMARPLDAIAEKVVNVGVEYNPNLDYSAMYDLLECRPAFRWSDKQKKKSLLQMIGVLQP